MLHIPWKVFGVSRGLVEGIEVINSTLKILTLCLCEPCRVPTCCASPTGCKMVQTFKES